MYKRNILIKKKCINKYKQRYIVIIIMYEYIMYMRNIQREKNSQKDNKVLFQCQRVFRVSHTRIDNDRL